MGRPKKCEAEQTAQRRLQDAFIAELSETPYAKISVAKVVGRAKVNRNTFYYHYECMEDLARDCVRRELPTQIAKRVLAAGSTKIDLEENEGASCELDQTLAWLKLIAGPQGSGILGEMLREEIQAFWLSVFGLTPSDLTEPELMAIAFTSSGLISMVAELNDLTFAKLIRYIQSDLFANASKNMIEMLENAHKRKYPKGIDS